MKQLPVKAHRQAVEEDFGGDELQDDASVLRFDKPEVWTFLLEPNTDSTFEAAICL
jgi:hypothetical protein